MRASIRSVSGVVWSGGSVLFWGCGGAWLVVEGLGSRSPHAFPLPGQAFGILLLVLGAMFFGFFLFFAFGRTEVRVIGDRGRVATGLWLWRSVRKFSWDQVSEVREERQTIVLRNVGRSFGSLLPDHRRRAVATALAGLLAGRAGS